MWNEQKSQRLEDLRNRKASLSSVEQAEFVELALELERVGTPLSNDWLGAAALVCGCIAWLATCVTLLADMGRLPRELKFGGGTLLLAVVCMFIAVFGGGFSARTKTGVFALCLGVLLPVAFMTLVCLVGSGWQD